MLGTVESYASVGVEPKIMGIGPVPAVRKALEKAGLRARRRRRVRAQRGVRRAVARGGQGARTSRTSSINPHGGAIALGHPIGASGGRILVTLLHEMKRTGAHRGLATLCVGGGQGQAAIIRRS